MSTLRTDYGSLQRITSHPQVAAGQGHEGRDQQAWASGIVVEACPLLRRRSGSPLPFLVISRWAPAPLKASEWPEFLASTAR